jgi:soluble lytic murein transglycosylase-like protein
MVLRSLPALLTLFAGLVLFPVTASAQIYVWRDGSGNLVLSDRPKDPSARTFAVSAATSFRATRRVSNPRSTMYDGIIEEHAAANGVQPALVRAVIQAESAFNPRARSVKGAMGLMQLMPATASDYGVVDPYDPRQNIRAGVAYLKSLLERYSNRVELALAAYNAGPGAVEKYGAVPPYRETKAYVAKIQNASTQTSVAPTVPAARIYRTVTVVDGREVPRYSNVATPGAELVTSAPRR